MDNETKLQRKAQIISRIADAFDSETMSQEDFIKAFEMVITFVQESYKLTQSEVENLRSMFVEAVSEMKNTTNENLASTKARLVAYCEEEMSKIAKSHKEMMQKCEDKLAEVKDGQDADEERVIEEAVRRIEESKVEKTPEELANILNQKEEIIEQETIIGLKKKLQDLEDAISKKNVSTNIIGGAIGGGHTAKVHDLSDSLDGVTKTFALPAFWRVLNVYSTSTPVIFRPTVDYTTDASAMTITFTSQIDETTTLSAGQTLLVLYSE